MENRVWLMGLFQVALMSTITATVSLAEEGSKPMVSRVEVVLANQYRAREAELKEEFSHAGFANVHFQFARMGQPPQNIGLGREVPSFLAREATRLALKYNLDIRVLLPERLFPPRFITIASSNYDDTVEYSIDQKQLKRLQDPALSTDGFHQLYRDLTSGVSKSKGRSSW